MIRARRVISWSLLFGMDAILIVVERCPDSGQLIASWEEPSGDDGISTQAVDLRDLQGQVDDAVRCHFEPGFMPKSIRNHFVSDPVLATT